MMIQWFDTALSIDWCTAKMPRNIQDTRHDPASSCPKGPPLGRCQCSYPLGLGAHWPQATWAGFPIAPIDSMLNWMWTWSYCTFLGPGAKSITLLKQHRCHIRCWNLQVVEEVPATSTQVDRLKSGPGNGNAPSWIMNHKINTSSRVESSLWFRLKSKIPSKVKSQSVTLSVCLSVWLRLKSELELEPSWTQWPGLGTGLCCRRHSQTPEGPSGQEVARMCVASSSEVLNWNGLWTWRMFLGYKL